MERKHRSERARNNYNDARSRSRSPYRNERKSHKRRRTESPAPTSKPHTVHKILPFRAQRLHKHDFEAFKHLFALYLDVQKEILVEDLSEREVKGRWKSFVRKWNERALAEGWYDPATKAKADDAVSNVPNVAHMAIASAPPPGRELEHTSQYMDAQGHTGDNDDSEDDDFGPSVPRTIHRSGPSIPTTDDLALARELRSEESQLARLDLAYDRKAERKIEKERLEELVPRADAGTRERQLEKKREAAVGNEAFRETKEGGDVEVREADLMGDDGMEEYKRQKVDMQRRKTAKEVRREEAARARIAERDERMKVIQEKEDKTMEYLKALVKERFG